jgi:hypothetical protein
VRLQIFKHKKVILGLILFLALGLRLYGINWDQGHHLHPDERFLTMVATNINWPNSFGQYFQTRNSPLNPRNQGYDFFVYGTFPVFLTKAVAELFNWGDYMHLTLIGRFLAVLTDVGVIIVLYKLTKKIWASLFYTLMVLPIQLAHFYAVDPWLNLFLIMSFYAALSLPFWLVGIFLGLALASKITAILFVPILFLTLLKRYKKINWQFILKGGIIGIITLLTFRIFSPYSFINLFNPNHKFIANLKQLQSFSDPNTWFPPAVQWLKTKPIIFPVKNIFFWGLGIPMGVLVLIACGYFSWKALKQLFNKKEKLGKRIINLLDLEAISIFWILFLLIFQGSQFSKTLRYFLPIYPFMAIVLGKYWQEIKLPNWVRGIILGSLFFWPLFFINIYTQTHPRIKASKWIYKNVPPGSTLSCELWDDCLPLSFKDNYPRQYKSVSLPVFDPDSPKKWRKINQQLAEIDYLILSSGRAWEPITANADRYPQMAEFYENLFNGDLNFKKAAEFTSYPGFIINGFHLKIKDDRSEEAFTVYDHPKVMIFKKTNSG